MFSVNTMVAAELHNFSIFPVEKFLDSGFYTSFPALNFIPYTNIQTECPRWLNSEKMHWLQPQRDMNKPKEGRFQEPDR